MNCVGSISNIAGNVWIMWKSGVQVNVIHNCAQYITIEICIANAQVIISFVHASCDSNERLSM